MRQLVGHARWAAYRRSSCVRSAASGRRPSAGSRSKITSSGASSHIDTPSRLIATRVSGSANVPPPVATTVCRSGMQQLDDIPLDAPEIGFPVAREDVGNRQPLPRLDQLVHVLDAPPQPRPSARATLVLPAAMNPTR